VRNGRIGIIWIPVTAAVSLKARRTENRFSGGEARGSSRELSFLCGNCDRNAYVRQSSKFFKQVVISEDKIGFCRYDRRVFVFDH